MTMGLPGTTLLKLLAWQGVYGSPSCGREAARTCTRCCVPRGPWGPGAESPGNVSLLAPRSPRRLVLQALGARVGGEQKPSQKDPGRGRLPNLGTGEGGICTPGPGVLRGEAASPR